MSLQASPAVRGTYRSRRSQVLSAPSRDERGATRAARRSFVRDDEPISFVSDCRCGGRPVRPSARRSRGSFAESRSWSPRQLSSRERVDDRRPSRRFGPYRWGPIRPLCDLPPSSRRRHGEQMMRSPKKDDHRGRCSLVSLVAHELAHLVGKPRHPRHLARFLLTGFTTYLERRISRTYHRSERAEMAAVLACKSCATAQEGRSRESNPAHRRDGRTRGKL